MDCRLSSIFTKWPLSIWSYIDFWLMMRHLCFWLLMGWFRYFNPWCGIRWFWFFSTGMTILTMWLTSIRWHEMTSRFFLFEYWLYLRRIIIFTCKAYLRYTFHMLILFILHYSIITWNILFLFEYSFWRWFLFS